MRVVFAIIWGHTQLPGRRQETSPRVIEFDTMRPTTTVLLPRAVHYCGLISSVNEN